MSPPQDTMPLKPYDDTARVLELEVGEFYFRWSPALSTIELFRVRVYTSIN